MAASYLYEAVLVELLALEPSVGVPAGGTAVVLTGRGFQAAATVTFDGVAATSAVIVSSDRITAVTPAHALGAVDVVVTNPDASTATLADGFSYETTAPASAFVYRTSGGSASAIRLENAKATITQHLGQAATFQFTAEVEPTGEQRVEYRAFGVPLFLGTVTHTSERVDGAERLQAWDTTATDLSHRLSRRRPTGSWIATSGTAIITALMAGFAPGFSPVIEGGLAPITLKLDGSDDLWAVLVDVCERCGASLVLRGTTLHVFTADLGAHPPDVVTEANPDLLWIEGNPVTLDWDYSQIRNRVTVRGAEGITATLDHAGSIASYDVTEFLIDDTTLTTSAELHARAQAELDAWALPIPTAHYATRDLRSTVGKSVAISLTRPAISATFVITSTTIDQLDLAVASPPTRPRFVVTARPASASIRSAGDQSVRLMDAVIDLSAAAEKAPRLTGDIVSEPGGRTTIPAGSIPATKLAGCLDSTLLTETGVTAGPHGDDAHMTTFTVDAAGRITGAVTDPVPVLKTDGSQPYTAPQSMGGFALTDVLDPVDPQDVATKAYVDAEVAAGVPGPTGPTGPAGASGVVVQVVRVQTGAVATGTTGFPLDDTIPQNTEGDEYMTLAITPASATNRLKIEVVAFLSPDALVWVIAGLFQDTTANALAAFLEYATASGSAASFAFTHDMVAGTTSATTFKLRGGRATYAGSVTTFNGLGGARYLGGTMASSLTITEYTP